MARFNTLTFDPTAYVASALAQTAQGPPLDPLTLICAVVAHHLSLPQNLSSLFRRA